MEPDRLKQRLVGAAVLVALAVIFVPMLLSGPDPLDQLVMDDNIPERPADRSRREVIDLDEEPPPRPETPETPAIVDEHTGKSDALPPPRLGAKVAGSGEAGDAEASAPPEQDPAPESAAANAAGEDEAAGDSGDDTGTAEAAEGMRAWSVQVGSFRDRGNAMTLRDRLRGQDFAAYVERYRSGEDEVYRVRVGPEPDRAAAEALQEALRQEGGVRGMVVRHGLDQG